MNQTSDPSSTAIQIEGVWKIFGNRAIEAMAAIEKDDITKQQVLEQYDCVIGVADVSLKINRGEIFCIMGLSGSGKSTLVRHINRLLEPTKGRIIVNGKDVLAFSDEELRHYRNLQISGNLSGPKSTKTSRSGSRMVARSRESARGHPPAISNSLGPVPRPKIYQNLAQTPDQPPPAATTGSLLDHTKSVGWGAEPAR